MKLNYLLIVFLIFSTLGYAQKQDVEGIVKEKGSGMPLYGVNILDTNSSNTASTDFDGKFFLKGLKAGSTLVFSYVGYKTYEYKIISSDTKITVVLESEAKNLNEVVVIGYGSVRKKQVTGAVTVIGSKTIEALNPIKIEQALQGTVSGVNVTTKGGAPGAELSIRIRGIATNGENKPAVIIDGVVGDFSTLNPDDVESLTVLKDAQAAIYGTIAANGVILVTTKSGKRNTKAKISYNAYTGIQEASRKLPMLNGTQYALLLNERYANGGNAIPFPNVSGIGVGTDWQDEVLKDGVPMYSHELSVSGGSENINYAASGSYLSQDGIIGGSKAGFERSTARIALGADITSKLKLKTNFNYTYQNQLRINDFALGSVLFNALNVPSTQSPYDSNGDYSQVPSTNGIGYEVINPLAQVANTFNNYDLNKISGVFALDYKFTDAFVLSGDIGFNNQTRNERIFNKEVNYGAGKVFNVLRNNVDQNVFVESNYTFDLYATYSKKFKENNLVATLGNTVFKDFGNGLYAKGYDVPYNSWDYASMNLAKGLPTTNPNNSYNSDERRLSYFARLQYDYKGKYLLSAMLRRDSSTKFGPNNRVAYFPSMTAGWIVSDENFFGGDEGIVSFLKLRGSYGILGNDQIPTNGYVSILNGEAQYVFNGIIVNGVASGQVPNPDLKWEEAKKFDVGFDMKLFQNKINIIADYFIDTRADLLIQDIPVSGINGVGAPGAKSPTLNAGTVRNSGFEFAIDYKTKLSENLTFTVGYNATFIKNEVLAVNNGTGFIEKGSFGVGQPFMSRMQEGQPLGYFYGYKTAGIFQNQAEVDAAPSQATLGANAQVGDIRYQDLNGDGVVNLLDRTNIGDPIAEITSGLNLQLNYKNLDFSLYTSASFGNNMVRNYERDVNDVNHLDYVLDRWTGEGTSNKVPRVTTGATANTVFSDYYVEDASYIRIQNVQLGYTLSPTAFGNSGLTKVRFYLGANNLYTFTKYMGYDPSSSSGDPIGGGIDTGFYPVARTYILGLNVNF